ncbi:hypothetical protein [Mycobacterium sp. EPa45]|uniref:hypothetical protein n=1 Tax=Mycobacterium sp. EPa45 TaxID=1545728 RepID=UPI00069BFC78|nr:hypothetical protein [Mycobacterium sp. EPa45]
MTFIEDFFTDLARAIPNLPGAACRGRHHLFDPPGDGISGDHPDEVARRQTAVDICNGCPALTPCALWLASLPRRQRPAGVVAGRIIAEPTPPKLRPPATPKPPRATKADRAANWLAAHMAAVGGSDTSAAINAAAAAAGHHRATVHQAAQRLGVTITRTSRNTTWTLQAEPEGAIA